MVLIIMLLGQAGYIYLAPLFPKNLKMYEYTYLAINLSFILLIVLIYTNKIAITESILTLIALLVYSPIFIKILKRSGKKRNSI